MKLMHKIHTISGVYGIFTIRLLSCNIMLESIALRGGTDMFLNELNKKESIGFVNLVEILAKIDNVFAQSEKKLLNEYIEELSLTNELIEKLTFESAVKELLMSTDRVKKIIYFELVGLALADGSYDEKEVEFLDKLAAQFNISSEKQQDFVNYFKMVKNVYDSKFVDSESKIKFLEKSAEDLL